MTQEEANELQRRCELARARSRLRKPPAFVVNSPRSVPLHPVEPEPVKRRALVRRVPREKTSGPRFAITFTVFAVRPCDWDGWHIKPLLDMVVNAGIIPGDTWYQLEGSVRSFKVYSEEEERTEIEIVRLT